MTEIELRFDHRNKKNCAYYRPVDYRPVDDDPDRGPSLLVNQTFVSEYFRGMDPENAGPTLIVRDVSTRSTSTDARPPKMTKIELRFHHLDNGNFSYYKSVDDDRDRGPSLFVNQTLVSEYFRGMDPENTKATLIVGNASNGRTGVGEFGE